MFPPLLILYCYIQPTSVIFLQKTPNHYHIPNPPHCTSQYIIQFTTNLALGAEWPTHAVTLPHFWWALFHGRNRTRDRKAPRDLFPRNRTQGILWKTSSCARSPSRAFLLVRHVWWVSRDITLSATSCQSFPAVIAPRVSWQQCPGFAIPPFLQEHTAAFTSPLPAAEGSRNVATAAGDFSFPCTFSYHYKQRTTDYFWDRNNSTMTCTDTQIKHSDLITNSTSDEAYKLLHTSACALVPSDPTKGCQQLHLFLI